MKITDFVSYIRNQLEKNGFSVSKPFLFRPSSFDIIAKRDNILIILKYVSDTSQITKEMINDFNIMADFLKGAVIIFGNNNKNKKMEDGVLYTRFGIPVVTPATLLEWVNNNESPYVFSVPGGLFANLRGETIKNARIEKNISLGSLANMLGVSRKAVQYYESGHSADISIALKIEEYLEEEIIEPVDLIKCRSLENFKPQAVPFSELSEIEKQIYSHLNSLGCDYKKFSHFMPFEGITVPGTNIFLTAIADNSSKAKLREETLRNISEVVDKESVVIVRQCDETVLELPVFTLSDVLSMGSPQEFFKKVMEV